MAGDPAADRSAPALDGPARWPQSLPDGFRRWRSRSPAHCGTGAAPRCERWLGNRPPACPAHHGSDLLGIASRFSICAFSADSLSRTTRWTCFPAAGAPGRPCPATWLHRACKPAPGGRERPVRTGSRRPCRTVSGARIRRRGIRTPRRLRSRGPGCGCCGCRRRAAASRDGRAGTWYSARYIASLCHF